MKVVIELDEGEAFTSAQTVLVDKVELRQDGRSREVHVGYVTAFSNAVLHAHGHREVPSICLYLKEEQ